MVKSLRGRLLVWQALILAAVVGGFGWALYLEMRKARTDEVDAELTAAARVLEGSLRTFPDRTGDWHPDLGPPPRRPPPPGEDGRRGPPPDGPHGRPPPREPPRDRIERALSLPEADQRRYADIDTPPYFVVWQADRSVLKASAPNDVPPWPTTPPEPRQVATRQRGPLHEVMLLGPGQTVILVGRSTDKETGDLKSLAVRIALTGLGVFAVGLAGGWWLTGRAVRPIQSISMMAATVTASNLSRRIDLAGVDSELGQLGGILNAMLDRLEGAFERQARFTADASHELRTPLAVVLAHVELALARPRPAEELRAALETCRRAARRMTRLVDDLLTLARTDAGQLELKPERLNLTRLAEEVALQLRPLAEERGVRLQADGPRADVVADPERMTRVVTNLIHNAILYNRPRGRVTASTACEGAVVTLTVADTGIGIPPADLPHVFERFYRVDKARARESGGSGLGLAICREIVERQGGAIGIDSQVDVGTTVVVRLPGG